MKQIAIITGASGGVGREFVRQMYNYELDEIWVVARNQEKLGQLQKEFGKKIVPISADLSQRQGIDGILEKLQKETVMVKYLVNNAGIARMGASTEFSLDEMDATIDLNCKAAIMLCNICISYMQKGSKIINVSSASSFQPVPYINLYASTKAFLRSYSRALNVELKGTGIAVTAVCPGWVDTELLPEEMNGEKVRYPGIVTAERVVKKALRDVARGRDMSVCSLGIKLQHMAAKYWPQRLVMKLWMLGIRKFVK